MIIIHVITAMLHKGKQLGVRKVCHCCNTGQGKSIMKPACNQIQEDDVEYYHHSMSPSLFLKHGSHTHTHNILKIDKKTKEQILNIFVYDTNLSIFVSISVPVSSIITFLSSPPFTFFSCSLSLLHK